jgi:hypothetical protein
MRGRRRASRLRFLAALTALVLIILIAVAIIYDVQKNDSLKPLNSKSQSQSVNGSLQTFYTGYFRFQDTGKWILNQQESTETKYVYYKYHGLQITDSLFVYVNQVPIPLYLATARVLPVREVNDDSLEATTISGPCGSTYKTGELRKIKIVTINGAAMLCDPDTPQYTVVLARVDGDYLIKMKRFSGASVSFVITFRDYNLEPQPETLTQIANSFQAL